MSIQQRPPLDQKTNGSAAHGIAPSIIMGLIGISHLAILILLYGQTFSFDYVLVDDVEYILENPAVRSGMTWEGIQWAFSSMHMHNWHPLTWLSHMLDASFFGTDPGWAHIHNTVLHGINSLLVYVFLFKLSASRWTAYLLSMIFLVHPLHVESVAWIAERKDLLCAFFYLLGLVLYDRYRSQPGKFSYFCILIVYALALMSKPMAVTLPIVLLIFDYFIYQKHFQIETEASRGYGLDYSRAVFEKLPLLCMSVVICAVTIVAQDALVFDLADHPISSRWANASESYLIYLKQFVIPIELAPFYPLTPVGSISLVDLMLPGFILLSMAVLTVMLIPPFPLIAAGFSFYLVTLLPVIGLIQVAGQQHADRYMYIPSIGILIPFIYLVPAINKRASKLVNLALVLFIAHLTIVSFWQVGYWQNHYTFWSRILDISGPNYRAYIELALDYFERRMLEESRLQALKAIEFLPSRPEGYRVMGNIAMAEHEYHAAEQLYRMTQSRGGDSAELQNDIGVALAEQDDIVAGLKAFRRALYLDPTLLKAENNIRLYSRRQKFP